MNLPTNSIFCDLGEIPSRRFALWPFSSSVFSEGRCPENYNYVRLKLRFVLIICILGTI